MKSELQLNTVNMYQKMLQYKIDRLKREKAAERLAEAEFMRQGEIAKLNESHASALRLRHHKELVTDNMRLAKEKCTKEREEARRFTRDVLQLQDEYSRSEERKEQLYREKYQRIQKGQDLRQQQFQDMFFRVNNPRTNHFFTEGLGHVRNKTPIISKTKVRDHAFDPVTGAVRRYKRNLTPQRSLGNLRREVVPSKVSEVPFVKECYERPKRGARAVSFNPITHQEINYGSFS